MAPPPAGSATPRLPGTCSDAFGTRAPRRRAAPPRSARPRARRYSQTITGPHAGATYYFCAIAANAVGTCVRRGAVVHHADRADGDDQRAPTLVTTTRRRSTATANPNGDAATGWFRYSTTNPGTCNDTLRHARAGGRRHRARRGHAHASYTPGDHRADAGHDLLLLRDRLRTRRDGVRHGRSRSRRPRPPAVTTAAATPGHHPADAQRHRRTRTGATTTGWFRYARPTRAPATTPSARGPRPAAAAALGAGTIGGSYAFSTSSTGLSPGTTYYYCAIASNAYGTAFGAVLSFTTPAARRRSTTSAATARHRDRGDAQRRRRTRAATPRPAGSATARSTRALQRHVRHARPRHAAASTLGSGNSSRPLLAGHHRPHAGHDLLLLRDRARTRSARRSARCCRSRRRTRPTVTTSARDASADDDRRHAQRLGQPERRRRPPAGSATARPTRAPATTRSARARRRAAARALGAGTSSVAYSAADQRARRRHDLLLLRDRGELGRHGVRPVLSFTTLGRAGGDDVGGDVGRRARGATLNGSANPNGVGDDRLVPLRADRPGHLQRHVRHARAGERRQARARRRHARRCLLAADHAA